MLREMDLDWLVALPDQDRESEELGRARSAREDLRELVQGLRSVLLAPPKLLWVTMDMLDANSLAFSSDSVREGADEDRTGPQKRHMSAPAQPSVIRSRETYRALAAVQH